MSFGSFLNQLDGKSRLTLLVGTVAIVAGVALAGAWLTRSDYQILFSGMSPQDSSVMMAELDKQKIPYRLEGEGTALLVPQEMVHKTRIRLLGQNLPLNGAVGFELFNTSDFGMTEFAQRINFQRALQGEITRTILSLNDVESARVLLALPEQGLFRKGSGEPRASIALKIREGRSLSSEQVLGIQRLVSASIPDIPLQNVTIVNHRGVALTAMADGTDGISPDASLALKRSTELYINQKVTEVLDQTFGIGVAMASVDVVLNMDRARTTTEDVVPSTPASRGQPTGVVVREKRSVKEADDGPVSPSNRRAGSIGSSQNEIDYQAGRRIEEIVTAPGVIVKMRVTAVVRSPMDAARIEQIKVLVGNAAGAVLGRGDSVVVVAVGSPLSGLGQELLEVLPQEHAISTVSPKELVGFGRWQWTRTHVVFILVGTCVLLLLMLGVLSRTGRSPAQLTTQQREEVLRSVRTWLEPESVHEHKADV